MRGDEPGRFWRTFRHEYAQEKRRRTARPEVHRQDALDKCKLLFVVCVLTIYVVRGAARFLGLSEDSVQPAEYALCVPLLLAVVVIVSTWLRRWGHGQ